MGEKAVNREACPALDESTASTRQKARGEERRWRDDGSIRGGGSGGGGGGTHTFKGRDHFQGDRVSSDMDPAAFQKTTAHQTRSTSSSPHGLCKGAPTAGRTATRLFEEVAHAGGVLLDGGHVDLLLPETVQLTAQLGALRGVG